MVPGWSVFQAAERAGKPQHPGGHHAGLEIAGATALVTGASRGFGRGIAIALSRAGAQVIGVARDRGPLEELRAELGGSFTAVAADAADPNVAGRLIDTYRPGILVLNAGAIPLPRPIQQHTWQTFSRNWEVDVRHVFGWTREALLAPLAPGSTVITLSSGAALRGSPLSGGYAGAKAAIRWLTAYAAQESGPGRARHQVRLAAAAADAGDRAGRGVRRGLRRPGPGADPGADRPGGHRTGRRPGPDQDAYVLTGAGLRPL